MTRDVTPWVLLRGLTREAGHWGPFPEQLRQAVGDAPVRRVAAAATAGAPAPAAPAAPAAKGARR